MFCKLECISETIVKSWEEELGGEGISETLP